MTITVIFALAVSLAFAFLSKQRMSERIQYTVWAFLAFLVVAVGIGWLMYPFSLLKSLRSASRFPRWQPPLLIRFDVFLRANAIFCFTA